MKTPNVYARIELDVKEKDEVIVNEKGLMSKKEFDDDMENRYKEALNEKEIEANKYFEQFRKKVKKNAKKVR